MLLRELCQRTGYSKDTIRFYEKEGLLPVKRQGRGFKQYTDWHVVRLLQIRYAKAAGFTLRQIHQHLTHWLDGSLTLDQKQAILATQIQAIDQAIGELQTVRRYLEQKSTLIAAGVDPVMESVSYSPVSIDAEPTVIGV